jgi:hypothetical protein
VSGQWSKERFHIGNLIRHPMLTKNVTLDDPGLSCFGNIIDTRWQNGVTVVYEAVFREKADETLRQ